LAILGSKIRIALVMGDNGPFTARDESYPLFSENCQVARRIELRLTTQNGTARDRRASEV